MTPEQFQEVSRIYQQAAELAAAERPQYLIAACAGDEALRAEVEALLRYEDKGAFLDQHALELATQILKEDQSRSLAGQQVGHCQLRSLLGKGGMGEVWLAEDTQLGRQVAVKILPEEFTADAARVRRFTQEARATSALNHPNILTIHEIGTFAVGAATTHYIVTEFIDGETLRERLRQIPNAQMPAAAAVELAVQIAAALAAAHEAGIIHRDIKPENVMVRKDGLVKVLDFGLAKLTERKTSVAEAEAPTQPLSSTDAGLVLGTPRYMSPEQARGERVDARTDIFSFGVLLYELLTGHAPFMCATTSETIAAILRDEPPPLTQRAPGVPGELERIVSRAPRKERDDRYQTISALLGDLKELKQQLELPATLKFSETVPQRGYRLVAAVKPPCATSWQLDPRARAYARGCAPDSKPSAKSIRTAPPPGGWRSATASSRLMATRGFAASNLPCACRRWPKDRATPCACNAGTTNWRSRWPPRLIRPPT